MFKVAARLVLAATTIVVAAQQPDLSIEQLQAQLSSLKRSDIQSLALGAESGDVPSQSVLGHYLFILFQREKKPELLMQARKWLLAAAEHGEANAAFQLSTLDTDPRNTGPSTAPEVIRWEKRAAELGHYVAQLNYCSRLRVGLGVPADPEEARVWCRRSAEQGFAMAQIALGTMALADKNHSEAEYWLKKAAGQGVPLASALLANIQRSGPGVYDNPRDAERKLLPSAQADDAAAQLELAELYLSGSLGDRRDDGLRWLKRSAGASYAPALHKLAKMHATGDQVELDRGRARDHWRQAADLGFSPAQVEYARLLHADPAGANDPIDAYKWAKIAVALESAEAEELLKEISSTLSAEQRSLAESVAQAWIDSHPDEMNYNRGGKFAFRGKPIKMPLPKPE